MISMRHFAGLILAIAVGALLYAAWIYYPDFLRWEPIRPYRGYLTEWRLPLFAAGGFLVLTLAEWVYTKTLKPDAHG